MMDTMRFWRVLLCMVPALAGAQNLADALKQGEDVFVKTCAAGYCHGPKGAGGGAPRLSGRGFDQAFIANTVSRDGELRHVAIPLRIDGGGGLCSDLERHQQPHDPGGTSRGRARGQTLRRSSRRARLVLRRRTKFRPLRHLPRSQRRWNSGGHAHRQGACRCCGAASARDTRRGNSRHSWRTDAGFDREQDRPRRDLL